MATNILSARGVIPLSVKGEVRAGGASGLDAVNEWLTPVKAPDLIIFTKQFRTLLKSGVPIVKLLEVVGSQTENIKLKKIIHRHE